MDEHEPRVRFINFEEPVEGTGQDERDEPEQKWESPWPDGEWDYVYRIEDKDEPVGE